MPAIATKQTVAQSEIGGIVENDADDFAHDQGQAEPLGKNQHLTTIREKVSMVTLKPSAKSKQVQQDPAFYLPPGTFVRPVPSNGIPHLEKHPAVIGAREKHASLTTRFKAVQAERIEACQKLGLDQDCDAEDRELKAAELLVGGKGTEAIEAIETIIRKEGALRAATIAAAKEIVPAIQQAVVEFNTQVEREILAPSNREVIAAWLTLARAAKKHQGLVIEVGSHGFSYGSEGAIFFEKAPIDTQTVSSELRRLLATGKVSPEECHGFI